LTVVRRPKLLTLKPLSRSDATGTAILCGLPSKDSLI